MSTPDEKIRTLEELPTWRAGLRKAGKKLVVTNGVFDLLHRGHAQYLQEAASFGDALLICINDNAGVQALKGPQRPFISQLDRAYLLASLEAVDAVAIFHGQKATEALRLAQPDIYIKGGDYTEDTLDREEYAVLKDARSEIKFIPFVGNFSTTNLAKKLRESTGEKINACENAPARDWNPALDFIFARRSIRKFQMRSIPEEMLRDLQKAALAAPSACGKNPQRLILVTDAGIKEEIARHLPNGKFLPEAAAALIICGDLNTAHGNELSYLLQDCSAACENVLLAATALGLGACWLGIHPRQDRIEALRKIFRLPENLIPVAGIALGWPGEVKPPRACPVQDFLL